MNQIELTVETRERRGKGASSRLRRQGRVPAIVYGYQVEPTAVSVDALELYHALHTEAGRNVLLKLDVGGDTHLAVARDLQTHPVKGDYIHVDLITVDKDQPISVEIPVHLVDEEEADKDGVINQILYTVPILVRPLETPNAFELSVAGLEIGDVRRVHDLASELPDTAEFDIDPERTVVTVNAPVSEAELEAMEASAGVEADEPEMVGDEELGGEDLEGEDADADADADAADED